MSTITNNKLPDERVSNATLIRLIQWADQHNSHYVAAALCELQERRKADSEPAGYHVIKECGKVGCSVATLEEAEKTRDFWNKKWIIRPYFYTPPARDNKQTDELVMWVKRLAHSLRNARPNSKLHSAAMDYLSRKGLISVEDVLR
ncbi:hypothetical protein H9B23_004478 [Salmonella enterica]|uniref:Uncharacterized protein n=1 Tax=Salmonella typhimurium TaxID=90371 RepID=A0A628N6N8_SALTM|nr:hypothetical protein [Salmonella enterica]EDF3738462.1 hypothetical protein [Salmonella enterica subsp. enterica serovar Typhimurium]ECX3924399.1 hypothetical protein [Salmonella enterica]EGB7088047.1 hypothetical protein [Salmonella enterica]EGC3536062.1 hypothetical protein [Salmonella enterica]